MSGKRNDVVDPDIVEVDGPAMFGRNDRQADAGGARRSRAQDLTDALQDQGFHRAALVRGARLETPVHGVRNVDRCPHAAMLPYLWLPSRARVESRGRPPVFWFARL